MQLISLLGWLICWLFDWLTDRLIDFYSSIVRLINRLIDWLFDWFIDWLIHCSIDRLIDWFTHCFRVTTTTDQSHATRGHFSSILSWRWTGIAVNMTRKAVSLSVNKPFSPRVSINLTVYFFSLPAWPVVIDEFVEYIKAKTQSPHPNGASGESAEAMEYWTERGGGNVSNLCYGPWNKCPRWNCAVQSYAHGGIVLCNHPILLSFRPCSLVICRGREKCLRFGSFANWSVCIGSPSHFFLPAVFDPDWYRSGKKRTEKVLEIIFPCRNFLVFRLWCERGWWGGGEMHERK